MPFTKQPHAEPIPGYRLIAPLGKGGFGEVWKCEAPGGLFKAIKFVYGNLNNVGGDATQAQEELKAIQCIKDLRHPFLLSIDRVESSNGELMIVTELADKNLHELLVDYQKKGLPGVPRKELLRYLAEAAEVLDLMNGEYGLQHLDIKPRNLFVVCKHVKVADFGLVTSMAANGAGVKLGAVTPLYASPEVFLGKVTRSSDQYSLACCFMELLTGKLPFEGRNSRQLLMLHTQEPPDLAALAESDRAIVGRALSKEPTQRFPDCVQFVRALQGKAPPAASEVHSPEDVETTPVTVARTRPAPSTLHARSEALVQTPSGKKQNDTDARGIRPAPAVPAGLPGYTFVQNQGSNPLADVWMATAPDGQLRQVKFVYGFTGRAEEAVRRLRALQHPALQRIEVVQSDPGCLVLLSDVAKETLRDRWQKCQAQKLPGIPRMELLGYLRTVAEALDYLYDQHALSHLALNPRSLLLDDDGLQIAEFGLAQLLWLPAGQPIAQRNMRYAPPELFDRQIHRSADQYSLALMYQELLTGDYAYNGQTRTATAESRARLRPDSSALPAGDRVAVERALDPDPQQRWPTCSDWIAALEESQTNQPSASHKHSDAFTDIIAAPHHPAPTPEGCAPPEVLHQIIHELIAEAGGAALAGEVPEPPRISNGGNLLEHHFRAGMPIGAGRVKIGVFRRHWHGQLVRDDDHGYEFHVPMPTNFWQQWMGRQPGLDITVRLSRQHALSATPIDVAVSIRAVRCSRRKAGQLIRDVGTTLLEGLRAFLLVSSEKRTQDRLLWPHPLQVSPVELDGTLGAPIDCRGKDISMSGMGFYLPHELATPQVVIHLPASGQDRSLAVPATLVRAQRCADGWYDVGALFRLAALRRSMPEMSLS